MTDDLERRINQALGGAEKTIAVPESGAAEIMAAVGRRNRRRGAALGIAGFLVVAGGVFGVVQSAVDTGQSPETAEVMIFTEPTATAIVSAPVVEESTDAGSADSVDQPSAAEAPAATQEPVTQVPTTQLPQTELPATQLPATQPSATQVPATQVPATQVAATQPAVVPTATRVPATLRPQPTATQVPATQPAVTQPAVTQPPVTQATATQPTVPPRATATTAPATATATRPPATATPPPATQPPATATTVPALDIGTRPPATATPTTGANSTGERGTATPTTTASGIGETGVVEPTATSMSTPRPSLTPTPTPTMPPLAFTGPGSTSEPVEPVEPAEPLKAATVDSSGSLTLAGGPPMVAAEVQVFGGEGYAIADRSGNFSLTSPEGSSPMTISWITGSTGVFIATGPVTFTDRTFVSVQINAPTAVVVTVVDTAGVPVSGVSVTAAGQVAQITGVPSPSGSWNAFETTDANGEVTLAMFGSGGVQAGNGSIAWNGESQVTITLNGTGEGPVPSF